MNPILLTLHLLACADKADDSAADDSAADDSAADDSAADDSAADDSADPGEAWSWCPGGAPEVRPPGTRPLEVSADALWCGAVNESRSLAEERAALSQLRLMPGTLGLPEADASGVLALLPACVMLEEGQEGLVSQGEGSLSVTWSEYRGERYYQASFTQPMRGPDGAGWLLGLSLSGRDLGELPPLDGRYRPLDGDQWLDAWVCEGASCVIYDRSYTSCGFEGEDRDLHTLRFEGGELELELRIGDAFAGTEPSAFVSARGTLDGQDFAQHDYWRLVYNPEHHHFSRDFIAFFDQPVGDACGLSALNLDPWNEPPAAELHLVDCEGRSLEQRAVTEEAWRLEP